MVIPFKKIQSNEKGPDNRDIPIQNMIRLFTDLNPSKAQTILLVLASQGIPARIEPHVPGQGPGIDLYTDTARVSEAIFHLSLYALENQAKTDLETDPLVRTSSFLSPPAFVIMVLITAVHILSQVFNMHHHLILEFGSSALYIFQGESFRAVTALFIHADGRHLLGNLAGLLIFGAPLISLSGYGTGPFLLVLAGTWGNLINAFYQGDARLSIGASTAIMGAAGSLAAFQITRKRPHNTKGLGYRIWNRMIPFFACATLVAMFSHGTNTDVSAHVFGFLAGLFWGIPFFPLHRTLDQRIVEPVSLAVCAYILVLALATGILS